MMPTATFLASLGILLAYGSAPSPSPSPSSSPPTYSPFQKPSPGANQVPTKAPTEQQPFVKPEKVSVPLNDLSVFTEPGIATLKDGNWVGRSSLLHIDKDIGIVIEIVRSTSGQELSADSLRGQISEILKKGGMKPIVPIVADPTPLPFFHCLILIQPIEKGYAAYCACRFFEDVQSTRQNVILPPKIVLQAITWEKQELLIIPTEQLEMQVKKSVQTMATSFADQFKAHPSNIQSENVYK